jgi:nucleotide-binding universal stress UspA family protein
LAPLAVSPKGCRLLHIGAHPPTLDGDIGETIGTEVELMDGPVIESILQAARGADLIVMPTAGHRGFLDALRGSTTEQVLRQAPCPVLAVRTGM